MSFKVFSVRCKNCGAEISFDPAVNISRCSYCGVTIIIEKDNKGGEIPTIDGILNPKIDEKSSIRILQGYLCASSEVPDDVLDLFTDFNNYLSFCPFYIYKIDYEGNWNADIGYYEWIEKKVEDPYNRGKMKTVREQVTRWQPGSGSINGKVTLYAPASVSLQKEPFDSLLEQIAYDVLPRGFKEFSANSLKNSSWLNFDTDEEGSFKRYCADRLNDHVYRRCLDMITGDTYKNFRKNFNYSYSVKRVFVPVWFYTFNYMLNDYTILVDAVNGNAYGKRPVSTSRRINTYILILMPFIFSMLFSLLTGQWCPKLHPDEDPTFFTYVIYYSVLLLISYSLNYIYHYTIKSKKADFPDLEPEIREKKIQSIRLFEKIYLISFCILLIFILYSVYFPSKPSPASSGEFVNYAMGNDGKVEEQIQKSYEVNIKGKFEGTIGVLINSEISVYKELQGDLKEQKLIANLNTINNRYNETRIDVYVYGKDGKIFMQRSKVINTNFEDLKIRVNITKKRIEFLYKSL